MGRPIVYCHACGKSLREADFEKGLAQTLDNRPYCTGCKPLEEPAPHAPRPALRSSSQRIAVVPAKPSGAPTARAPRLEPGGNRNLILVLAGGGVLIMALLVLMNTSSGRRPVRPDPAAAQTPPPIDLAPPPATPPPPSPPAPVRREEAPPRSADEEFRRAREEAARRPVPPAASAPGPAPEKPAPESQKPASAPPPEKPAPPPVPPKEADSALARWQSAMRLATARDYAAATQELKRISSPEGAADVELLSRLASHVHGTREGLAKLPRGQKVALEVLNADGAPEKVGGAVLRADAHRLEVQREADVLTIELGELTTSCLAELVRKRSPASAALLSLLEGDASAKDPSVPERYSSYARLIAEERANATPREAQARKLFYAMAQAAASAASTYDAIQKGKTLLADFADTAVVARNRSSIADRAQAGKEYFLIAADLAAAGTFRLGRHNKMESCWISESDVDRAKVKENYVEVAYSVLPDLEYRCWVYVGGCCLETLSFFVQGSELEAKTGTGAVAYLPGTDALMPAKLPVLSLRRLHSMHTGPKEPDRWVWVPIPLPKYATPGTKTVRLLSGQKGFGVAYALVSAQKAAPPSETQVKEWERVRSPLSGPPGAPVVEPDLVAWWRLDEGIGTTAADASRNRNDGTLRSGAAWAEGKIGRAIALDGGNQHVYVPDSPSFQNANAHLTVAAWVYRRANQASWRFVVNRPQGAGTIDQFWLGFDNDKFSFGVDTAAGEKGVNGSRAPNNEWIHMAGTYDGAKVRLYVNGAEAGSTDASGPIKLNPRYVTLGARVNHATGAIDYAFNGLIDEVSIRKRALAPAEIQALMKRKP